MTRDFFLGSAGLALAVIYYAAAAGIQESALSDTVGPQGLPKTYAIVLAALSLILIARSVRTMNFGSRIPDPGSPIPDPRSSSPFPLPPTRWRAAGIVAIGAIYITVVPWLGYVLSLAVLIAATAYCQGAGLNRRVAMMAASGALFFWVLFVFFLGIPHPPGFWPSIF